MGDTGGLASYLGNVWKQGKSRFEIFGSHDALVLGILVSGGCITPRNKYSLKNYLLIVFVNKYACVL